jgi:ABC-type glycerol-3-phosphate transport system substrate-binding protein
MFRDWDGNQMKCANDPIPQMYGYYNTAGTSTIYTYADPKDYKTQRLDDDDGLYRKSLWFLNQLSQKGLLDPDAPSNTWNGYTEKVKDGQILYGWWPWASVNTYYSEERANGEGEPKGIMFVPLEDGMYYNKGYNPATQWGNVMGIGSKAQEVERIFEVLDWACSPEGVAYIANQIEGLNMEFDSSGKPYLNEFGQKYWSEMEFPEEFGGGTYVDIHWGLISGRHPDDVHPDWGVPYRSNFWPSEIERNKKKVNTDWQQIMGAENMVDLLIKRGQYVVAPGNSYAVPEDSLDIQTARRACGQLLTNTSWQLCYAANDAEFNALWENLKSQLKDSGWADVVAVDLERSRELTDICLEILANN